MHQNVQCLSNKVAVLEFELYNRLIDIVCITEHWQSYDSISAMNLDGYNLVTSFCRQKSIHGGSAIYVANKHMPFCKKMDLNRFCSEFEFECCGMRVSMDGGMELMVVSIYRSPSSDVNSFISTLNNFLLSIKTGKRNLIICGDLNVNFLRNSEEKQQLFDLLDSYNYVNLIYEATRLNKKTDSGLDYCITNRSSKNSCVASVVNLNISDHLGQSITMEFPNINRKNNNKLTSSYYGRKYSKTNIDQMRWMLSNSSWNVLSDVNNIFQSFHETFTHCFECSFPKIRMKKLTKTTYSKNWISNDIKMASDELKALFDLKITMNTELTNTVYSIKKRIHSQRVKNAKSAYLSDIIRNAENPIKEKWKLIKTTMGTMKQAQEHILLRNTDGQVISAPEIVANEFGRYFSSTTGIKLNATYGKHLTTNCTLPKSVQTSLYLTPVTSNEVLDIVRQLKNTNSSGFDQIPSRILKNSIDIISETIAAIINKSFETGTFPDLLKTAIVKPIYKKNDKQKTENYRPISLLSIFSKIIEGAMYKRIMNYIHQHDILTKCQHGFRPNRSTSTASYSFVENVLKTLDGRQEIAVIYFDLTAAFDTICHNFLLLKLERMGIRGVVLNWLKTYLENRKIIIQLQEVKSKSYDLESVAVPQGSNLGPCLFLLYINDLPDFVKSGEVVMYADDSTVIVKAENLEELKTKIQQCLFEFYEWCRINHLIINIEKTKCMLFNRPNLDPVNFAVRFQSQNLCIVQDQKFLGIIIDSNLKWSKQIDAVCKKLNCVYYYIRTLSGNYNRETLLSVYYAFGYSAMKYCIAAWGHYHESIRVFRIQKRIIRLINKLDFRESCRPHFVSGKLLTFYGIYMLESIMYIKKSLHNLNRNEDIHQHNTRTSNKIHIAPYKTTRYANGPLCKGCSLFNQLPEQIAQVEDVLRFQRALKTYLISRCPYTADLEI